MKKIGIWTITSEGPSRVKESNLALEKKLEDWIENDPSLLQSGLTIIGRQVHVEGGPLDLLALDPQGQWIVIELKAGTLRRETVSQVLDYASCIATMPYDEIESKVDTYLANKDLNLKLLLEERGLRIADLEDSRDVIMYIGGAGREPGLERMVSFLGERYEVPINTVTFDVFQLQDGEQILLREITEAEFAPSETGDRKKVVVDDVLSLADNYPTGQVFCKLFDAAKRHNLAVRPWATCLMYAPPTNRTRSLYTVWAIPKAGGKLSVYVESSAFAEFFPVPEEIVFSIIGDAGYRLIDAENVDEFISNLDRLFEELERDKGSD